MSHKDVQGRRLKLSAALETTLGAMPRLWLGACGTLVVTAGLFLALAMGAVPTPAQNVVAAVANVQILVSIGALARLSVSQSVKEARGLGLGPGGFQFKWPELRLVGAALLCVIFLTMVIAILALVVLAIFGMADLDVAAIQARNWSAVGAPWKLGVLAIVGMGALMIPLLLAVRLSLFVPATLGRGQMVSLNSMGIAYGSFWQILGGLIVTAAPTIGLLALIGTGMLTERMASVVGVVVLIGLQLPLTLGFLGATYRQLEYWTREEAAP